MNINSIEKTVLLAVLTDALETSRSLGSTAEFAALSGVLTPVIDRIHMESPIFYPRGDYVCSMGSLGVKLAEEEPQPEPVKLNIRAWKCDGVSHDDFEDALTLAENLKAANAEQAKYEPVVESHVSESEPDPRSYQIVDGITRKRKYAKRGKRHPKNWDSVHGSALAIAATDGSPAEIMEQTGWPYGKVRTFLNDYRPWIEAFRALKPGDERMGYLRKHFGMGVGK